MTFVQMFFLLSLIYTNILFLLVAPSRSFTAGTVEGAIENLMGTQEILSGATVQESSLVVTMGDSTSNAVADTHADTHNVATMSDHTERILRALVAYWLGERFVRRVICLISRFGINDASYIEWFSLLKQGWMSSRRPDSARWSALGEQLVFLGIFRQERSSTRRATRYVRIR